MHHWIRNEGTLKQRLNAVLGLVEKLAGNGVDRLSRGDVTRPPRAPAQIAASKGSSARQSFRNLM